MIIKKLPEEHQEEEELFDNFIQKGGKTTGDNSRSLEEESLIRFSLRVPESLVDEIDKLRKNRYGRISRNLWIIEAIVHYMKK